ncbi:MAG: hypothetical protein IPO04_14285 [Cytophagaceae bacterium]|nr:hypothetical protein [Cytophagaceae bacterium]
MEYRSNRNSISVSPTSTTTYSAYCENGSCTSTIVSMPITVIPPPNCLNLTNVIVPTNCTVEGNTKNKLNLISQEVQGLTR